MATFGDRLVAAVRAKKTPLCIGIDPAWARLPESIRLRYGDTGYGRARAAEEFAYRVLDAANDMVPAVKVQAAFFEACGGWGWHSLQWVFRKAARLGMLAILDAKRGDIASTADAYAEMAFDTLHADAVTISPYLGSDTWMPFVDKAVQIDSGVFVLVRTSNPGASELQGVALADAPGHTLWQRVATAVERVNENRRGQSGFGPVGAVVAGTYAADLPLARRAMPSAWLLIPGYGAQGAQARDLASAFRHDGLGGLITASRSLTVIQQMPHRTFEDGVRQAIEQAIAELRREIPVLTRL